mmetsp:Transcript_16103/g.35374  ORF Transcript_16103/g.35374 Transcript_16103/m.35374 type:complete len:219 (+) Transcript_16103:966-1622(+)
MGSEGHRNFAVPIGLHNACRWRQCKGLNTNVVLLCRKDGAKPVGQFVGALVHDLELRLEMVLAGLVVHQGSKMQDAILGALGPECCCKLSLSSIRLNLQDRTHALTIERHKHTRVLREDPELRLVDLHQLRIELNHELKGFRTNITWSIEDLEACVLGQGLETELLAAFGGRKIVNRQRQDAAFLRCHLAKVEGGGVCTEDSRDHTGAQTKVCSWVSP